MRLSLVQNLYKRFCAKRAVCVRLCHATSQRNKTISVYLRGTHWHYRFMMSGKTYSGPCIGCENEKQAEAYEKQKRQSACVVTEEIKRAKEDVRKNKTIVALVENYRRELSGGTLIALGDAYALAPKNHQGAPQGRSTRICAKPTGKPFAPFFHKSSRM